MEPVAIIDYAESEKIEMIDRISKELGKELPKADKSLKMVVIIPAKNEGKEIVKTLESLINQRTRNNKLFNTSYFELLILCHNCSDNTYTVCLEFSLANPQININTLILDSDVANTVGAARRILMNIASGRLANPNGLIISTDADTIPDNNWLYNLEKYQKQEVSLIWGFINVDLKNVKGQAYTYLAAKDEYLLLKSKLEALILPNSTDPWPRHSYHWGPNMAIKKQVNNAIGGIQPLHFLEDVDMYYRVVSEGYIVKHCMKTKVITSTRIDSRCHEGFGAELRVWTEHEGIAYNVEGLDKLLLRFSIYNLVKQLYNSYSHETLEKISSKAFIDLNTLTTMFKQSIRFESLMIKIEKYLNCSRAWNENLSNVGVLQACSELKTYFGDRKISSS